MISAVARCLGRGCITLSEEVGTFTLFFFSTIKVLFTTRLKVKKLLVQIGSIGVDSFNIIVLTGSFTGMVFALQSAIGFKRIGGEQFIGHVVALGMIRELGPVLTGLMVAGRASSAIAAEIGTMRITEQIDALKILRINVFQYLVVPRVLASLLTLPFLALFSMVFGILGGYLIAVYVLSLSPELYTQGIEIYVRMADIYGGLFKASCFGFILSIVGAYKGFFAHGGSRGVGRVTTEAVVVSSILILMSNYFLTKLIECL